MKEENIKLLPEETDISVLDKLTGIPRKEDTLLHVIPMAAPYSSILNNKYKAKIQPGSMKRGKIAKSARELFMNLAKGSDVEAVLIKGLSE